MKTLQLPQEIIDLADSYFAAIHCRDHCIQSIFKAKKAIFYQKQAEKFRKKLWTLIDELYPETVNGNWTYDSETQRLLLNEPGDNKKVDS